MASVERFQNRVTPFVFNSTPARTFAADEQVSIAVDPEETGPYLPYDKVYYGTPTLGTAGFYSGTTLLYPTTKTTDDLGSNCKISYGFGLPKTGIVGSEVLVKFSSSVISPSQSVVVSAHFGVMSGSGFTSDRQFSFGDFGSQSVSYTDNVLVEDSTVATDIVFWVTVTNYSSSAQPYFATVSGTMWSSALPYPPKRDVNAP